MKYWITILQTKSTKDLSFWFKDAQSSFEYSFISKLYFIKLIISTKSNFHLHFSIIINYFKHSWFLVNFNCKKSLTNFMNSNQYFLYLQSMSFISVLTSLNEFSKLLDCLAMSVLFPQIHLQMVNLFILFYSIFMI